MSGDPQAALEEAEEKIGEEREKRGGDGAGQDERIADEGDSTKDERPEAAGPDGRGDGGHANGDDRRRADAREDYGEREREAHSPENLRAGHAHGFGGFEDSGINAGEADVGVAQNGEQRIEDEGYDSGAIADAADKRDGDKKSKERETGDGLENAGDPERDRAKRRALHDEHAERDTDQYGDGHGDDDEHEVIQ